MSGLETFLSTVGDITIYGIQVIRFVLKGEIEWKELMEQFVALFDNNFYQAMLDLQPKK